MPTHQNAKKVLCVVYLIHEFAVTVKTIRQLAYGRLTSILMYSGWVGNACLFLTTRISSSFSLKSNKGKSI